MSSQQERPQQERPQHIAEMTELLGYDPTKDGPTKSAIDIALANVNKRRDDKLVAKLEERIDKASLLAKDEAKLDSEYKKHKAKFKKEIGAFNNFLRAAQQGQLVQDPADNKEPKSEDNGGEVPDVVA